MTRKVLVASENPPQTYINALERVSLPFDASLFPNNPSVYVGLVLIGGGDVFPPFYGGDLSARDVNIVRDMAEFRLLEKFVSLDVPTLGICRGLQVENVFFGGTLKNVVGHYSSKKDVKRSINSISVLKSVKKVSSSHRQALDRLPPFAYVDALSKDQIPEIVFFGDDVFGTQFHPERTSADATDLIFGLFKRRIIRKFGDV